MIRRLHAGNKTSGTAIHKCRPQLQRETLSFGKIHLPICWEKVKDGNRMIFTFFVSELRAGLHNECHYNLLLRLFGPNITFRTSKPITSLFGPANPLRHFSDHLTSFFGPMAVTNHRSHSLHHFVFLFWDKNLNIVYIVYSLRYNVQSTLKFTPWILIFCFIQ